jgi:hypothetical protein
MKTKWYSMIRLGLAVVCLGLVSQSPAKKPVKPPPNPEPETGFPFTYQRADLEPVPGQIGTFTTQSLNNDGVICGVYETEDVPGGYHYWSFRWAPAANGMSYPAEQIELLDISYWYDRDLGGLYINNRGEVAGVYSYPNGPPIPSWWFDGVMVTNSVFSAVLYDTDGIRHNLWSTDPDDMSRSCAVNNVGEVVIVDCRDRTPSDAEYEDFSDRYWSDVVATYIVSPLDTDGDGVGDCWFVDNGSGTNALALPLGIASAPTAINSDGVITLSGGGGVIVPDFDDVDGDGNYWFADTNLDGVNDRIFGLRTAGGTAVARDITDSGLIAGACSPDNAGAYATIWPTLDSDPVVVPPPKEKLDSYSVSHVNANATALGSYNIWVTRKGMRPNRVLATGFFIYYDGVSYPTGDVPTSDGSYITQISDLNESGTILCWYGNLYIPAYPEP